MTTYNALISACSKGDNAEKALQLWVEMQRKGLEPDVITYSVSSTPAQGHRHGNLISACAKGDNAEKALQPWIEMQRKGSEPDVITFCALINACAKGDYEKALLLLAKMRRKGLGPS
jgi:pentatricopeptide repeat protein